MELEQSARVFGHAIDQLRGRKPVRIFPNRIEFDAVPGLWQILGNDSPHGGVAQAFEKILMELPAPDRIVLAPRIVPSHGERPACWLQSPVGPTQKTTRRIRLIKLQAMQVLAPNAVSAVKIVLE